MIILKLNAIYENWNTKVTNEVFRAGWNENCILPKSYEMKTSFGWIIHSLVNKHNDTEI